MVALTKEQKQARKEAKRLEKTKAENEAKRQAKRDELQREIISQAVRKGELDKSWRQMMMKIKEPVFRQDLEVMWHVFERAYDKKECLINYTSHLCEVADDQFQRTMSCFCDTTDTVIKNFLNNLEEMSADNDKRTTELLKYNLDIDDRIMVDHNAAETHMQLLLYHSHTVSDNQAWTSRGENLVKEDEEKVKTANERDQLRSFLENNYNALWDQYKAILRAYVMNTAENQKQVRKLRRKENQMADIIASQGKKIANSDGLLRRLRAELGAYESGTKQAVFRERRDTHRNACFRLKRKLMNSVSIDEKQLTTLVNASDEAIAWLNAAYKKCEKIMRIADLCRKFETQREKVIPYNFMIPHSPIQTKTTTARREQINEFAINAMSTTCGLTRLWQRISKAELTRKALLHEKKLLLQENANIEKTFKNQDDYSMTPDTRKCRCYPSSVKNRIGSRPVAIEGVQEINKLMKMNAI